MSENVQKIADIASDSKELLHGFKVLGIFPFYLRHIRTGTQVLICKGKDNLQNIKRTNSGDITINDFHDHLFMSAAKPIIDKIITDALINERFIGRLLYRFVLSKVRDCNHKQVFFLYKKINELSNPDFFLSYCQHMMKKDHTILKEE